MDTFPGWYPFWRNHTHTKNNIIIIIINTKRENCDNIHGMVREGHSHLTLTVCEEAECESLGHPCKVADASGVDSAGIGQGAQQVVGQIAAASL